MTTRPNPEEGALTPARKTRWHDRIGHSKYLVGAVLLHLIIFLLVGTVVIWRQQTPSDEGNFHRITIAVPPPPPPLQLPTSGAAAVNPQMEPDPVVVPVVTPPSAITTTQSNFTVEAAQVVNQALTHMADKLPQGAGLAAGAGDALGNGNSAFGSSGEGGNGFVGFFYDLKQTPDRKPTNIAAAGEELHTIWPVKNWQTSAPTLAEVSLLRRFTVNWDMTILDDYYKAPVTLVTTQVFIPLLSAADAPRAFGVEKTVEPRRWIIVYRAKIIPPKSGRFRFIGMADDILLVRINDQNALDADWPAEEVMTSVNTPGDAGLGIEGIPLHCGAWIDVQQGIDMEMQVMIGEGPGGVSGFSLFIQEDGVDYPKGDYPLFQLSDAPVPPYHAVRNPSDLGAVPPAFSGKKMVFGVKPD